MRVLILGCGYVGMALARQLIMLGYEVFGARRPSLDAARELEKAGIQPWLVDVTDAAAVREKPLPKPLDWVVSAIAPSAGGGVNAYEAVYVRGTLNMLDKLRECPPVRYSHISSTSVYAQDDGSVVTEESPAEPQSDTGRILLGAEQEVLSAGAAGTVQATILRSAGIYGPGRAYWLRRLQQEQPAEMNDDLERVLNMIHRDDLASAVIAAASAGRPGEIYNVVDDRPVRVRELRADESLRSALPPAAPGSARGTGTAVPRSNRPRSTNKRVSNAKLKRDTGWRPEFPSYREGFEAVLKHPGGFETGPT